MRHKRGKKPDIEQQAKAARAAREAQCDKAIQKVLADHDCQMSIVVQVGNQLVPLGTVLGFPNFVLIESK